MARGQKRGPAKTILGKKKSGPAIAGPAGPPTTALTLPASLKIGHHFSTAAAFGNSVFF